MRHVASALTFTLGLLAAISAQAAERPITAAIVFLFAITLVGALEGVRGGLASAVLASAIYNFFLSDPVFSFSLESADEYVPLLAFNLSAAASGYLVGRLRDRARAAELSETQVRALLAVSQRLQSAVTVSEISDALATPANGGSGGEKPELYINRGGALEPAGPAEHWRELASRALAGPASVYEANAPALLLEGASAPLGVLILPRGSTTLRADDELDAFASLVAIAVERCVLFEHQAEAQLLRRSEELKTALLSSVSHDVRTPLNAIKASASSLALYEGQLAPGTRSELLHLIQEQCDRLNRYTTNLLNLGRIQAGLGDLEQASCDALDVLGSAIHNVRALGTGHEIRKFYHVSSPHVAADAVMLEQVFYNVLENGVRYSESGSTVSISADAEGGELVIVVADEGVGIPQEDREKVFERFTRGGHSTREGSGLGLSIARGFLEAFGGSIQACSNDSAGRGVAIRMTLRLLPEQPRL